MKWPQKVYHFKVKDPFIRMFIAKYEHLIDWGNRSKWDERFINEAIQALLEKLLCRLKPGHPESIWIQQLDVERLRNDPHCSELFQKITFQAKAVEQTYQYLLDYFNKRKLESYKSWTTALTKRLPYRKSPAFGYLVLRPLLTKTNAKVRACCPPLNQDVLLYLFSLLKHQVIAGNTDLFDTILRLNSHKGHAAVYENKYHWIIFDRFKREHIPLICNIGRKGRWCLASVDMAKIYFKHHSLLFLMHDENPVACFLRTRPEGRSTRIEYFANARSFEQTPFKNEVFWDIEQKIGESFYLGCPIKVNGFFASVKNIIEKEISDSPDGKIPEKVINLLIRNPFLLFCLRDAYANHLLSYDSIFQSLSEMMGQKSQGLHHLETVWQRLGLLLDSALAKRKTGERRNLLSAKRFHRAICFESFGTFLDIKAHPEKFEKFPRHLQQNKLLAEAMVLGWENRLRKEFWRFVDLPPAFLRYSRLRTFIRKLFLAGKDPETPSFQIKQLRTHGNFSFYQRFFFRMVNSRFRKPGGVKTMLAYLFFHQQDAISLTSKACDCALTAWTDIHSGPICEEADYYSPPCVKKHEQRDQISRAYLRYVLAKPSPTKQRDFYQHLRLLHPSPWLIRLAKRTLHATYRKLVAAFQRENHAGVTTDDISDQYADNMPPKYQHLLLSMKIRNATRKANAVLRKQARYLGRPGLPESQMPQDPIAELPVPYPQRSIHRQKRTDYSNTEIIRRFAITHESNWERTPEFLFLLNRQFNPQSGISFRLDKPIFRQVRGLAAKMRVALALRYLNRNPFSWESFPADLKCKPIVYQAALEEFRQYIFSNLPSRPTLPAEFPDFYASIEGDPDFLSFCRAACRAGNIASVPPYQQSIAKDEARVAWVKMLRRFPNQIASCPEFLRHDSEVQQAELDGWCQWIAVDPESLAECPEAIKEHPQIMAFVKQILGSQPVTIKKMR